MKDIEKFKINYSILISEMNERMNEPENDRFIIDDGVMLPERYFDNELRLAWLLKEPYDGENGTGGGWSYFDMFKRENLYLEQFNKTHKTTWQPMIYVSYSLHNDFLKWSNMDYIRDNHQMCEIVKEVAFINAQKLPSKNETRTNFDDLHESLSNYNDLILKQIDLLDPNVFIFANTFNIYRKYLKLDNNQLIKFGSLNYIINEHKIYIDTYHPAQTTIGRQEYVDDIIEIVRLWKNNELF